MYRAEVSDPPMTIQRKPDWLRVRAPGGERYVHIKETLRKYDLYTVCEEAHCPNVGECWGEGTATIMILGDTCTRGCLFCAVNTGNPRGAYDPREPEHVGRTIGAMGLDYVVITMVDRDDLIDGGAAHTAETLRAIRRARPGILIEALVGDYQGSLRDVATVVTEGRPDVFAHNVETVERLQRTVRDARCSTERSLAVLAHAKRVSPATHTKSSIMVGLGESRDEVLATMRALREVGVDVVTLGQYLRPSPKHHEVVRYVHPDEFAEYKREGEAMGFRYVASGPLVRSSYKAAEAFLRGILRGAEKAGEDEARRRRPLPVVA